MSLVPVSLKTLIVHTAGRDVAGDGDLWRVSAATVGDVDLAAGNVELGSTSNMQSNLLNADEILGKKGIHQQQRNMESS